MRDSVAEVLTVWHSTLLPLEILPFPPATVPDNFTLFRRAVEARQVQALQPMSSPGELPPLPPMNGSTPSSELVEDTQADMQSWRCDASGAMSDNNDRWSQGGERAALAHLKQYCDRKLPHTYKATRNALMGVDSSSKWSLWLEQVHSQHVRHGPGFSRSSIHERPQRALTGCGSSYCGVTISGSCTLSTDASYTAPGA